MGAGAGRGSAKGLSPRRGAISGCYWERHLIQQKAEGAKRVMFMMLLAVEAVVMFPMEVAVCLIVLGGIAVCCFL